MRNTPVTRSFILKGENVASARTHRCAMQIFESRLRRRVKIIYRPIRRVEKFRIAIPHEKCTIFVLKEGMRRAFVREATYYSNFLIIKL